MSGTGVKPARPFGHHYLKVARLSLRHPDSIFAKRKTPLFLFYQEERGSPTGKGIPLLK
jgi:hypothetical protein